MRHLHGTILATLLTISSAAAFAQSHMVGLAGQSCETWTANSPTAGGGLGLLYQEWVFGFLSGASYADPEHDPLKGVDVTTITASVNTFCQQNPTARIGDAAVAFVKAHHS